MHQKDPGYSCFLKDQSDYIVYNGVEEGWNVCEKTRLKAVLVNDGFD